MTTTATDSTFRRPEGVKVTFRRMRFPFEDAGFAPLLSAGLA